MKMPQTHTLLGGQSSENISLTYRQIHLQRRYTWTFVFNYINRLQETMGKRELTLCCIVIIQQKLLENHMSLSINSQHEGSTREWTINTGSIDLGCNMDIISIMIFPNSTQCGKPEKFHIN